MTLKLGRRNLTQVELDTLRADIAASGALKAGSYTFATLPPASENTRSFVFVTDRANRPAYSNGSTWKWVSDDANVS
jgi:hypothetical protein